MLTHRSKSYNVTLPLLLDRVMTASSQWPQIIWIKPILKNDSVYQTLRESKVPIHPLVPLSYPSYLAAWQCTTAWRWSEFSSLSTWSPTFICNKRVLVMTEVAFLFYFVHNARDLVSPASELRVSKQMNVFIDTEEKVVYLYWIEAEVYNLKSEIRNAVQKLSPIFQHNT